MAKPGTPEEGEEEVFASQDDGEFTLPGAEDGESEETDDEADVSLPTDEPEIAEEPEGGDAGSSGETDTAGDAGEGEGGDDEEIDLDELFSAGEDAQDALDDVTKTVEGIGADGASKEEVEVLKEQLERMTTTNKRLMDQLEKISVDKSELVVKNAELTAFGGDFTDSNVLILSRNLEKARNGDDKAKGKAVAVCKSVLEELTGEDYELEKADSKADALSQIESYNNKSKSDVPKSSKEENEDMLTFD